MKLDVHYKDRVRVLCGKFAGVEGEVIARRTTITQDWYCVKPDEGYCFIVHNYEIEKCE